MQIANVMIPEHLFRGEQTEEWEKVPERKFATESCQRTVAENPTEREASRKKTRVSTTNLMKGV